MKSYYKTLQSTFNKVCKQGRSIMTLNPIFDHFASKTIPLTLSENTFYTQCQRTMLKKIYLQSTHPTLQLVLLHDNILDQKKGVLTILISFSWLTCTSTK